MHAYSSFGRIYVLYRYARAEELWELHRRRMFFKEVSDLFRIALVYSVHRKSCWKVMQRWCCLRATVSSCSYLSKLWAVVQEACCHGGK